MSFVVGAALGWGVWYPCGPTTVRLNTLDLRFQKLDFVQQVGQCHVDTDHGDFDQSRIEALEHESLRNLARKPIMIENVENSPIQFQLKRMIILRLFKTRWRLIIVVEGSLLKKLTYRE